MNNYIAVNPLTIKVKDGLPRLRKDMGDISELAQSIKKFGQLQPILCNRDMELIAGGRRLLACIDAQIDVHVIFNDVTDAFTMREMELEENIRRKALTPAEEVKAVEELHQLKQALYGQTVQGRGGGWTIENTASLINRSRKSVEGDLALADVLKDFPILETCKKKSDIKRAMRGLKRISDSVSALNTYNEQIQSGKPKFESYNLDSLEYMKTIPDKSIDILLTDAPYGIDIHSIAIGLGGHTGSKVTMTGLKYEDDFDMTMALLSETAKESSRFVKDTGFAMVFCAIDNFWIVKAMFNDAGWNCSQRPVIWIKNESGQNNAPSKWMSAGYECLLFARKLDARLVIEGKVDWIQCPNLTPTNRLHQAEKPVPLLKELLSRVGMPGAIVFDPFAGSFSTAEAALELNMYPIVCELSTEAYAVGLGRISSYLRLKGEFNE